MQQLDPQIYVGTVEDYEALIQSSTDTRWSILGACKEPLHRKHAKLQGATLSGYMGRAMPKDEPEYLWAERTHALYCNLIDAPKIEYIPDKIIDKCMDFIDKEKQSGRKILIVCNKAESRSPSIALMYFIKQGIFDLNDFENFETVLDTFRIVYPKYNPSKGFAEYTEKFWRKRKSESVIGE